MSYDIQVWSVARPDLEGIASGRDDWYLSERYLTFQKASWQIVVGQPSRVEQEDIPDAVFQALPGIQFLTDLNLEPVHAPKVAQTELHRMGARIAKQSHGVVLDPQQDTISSLMR